MELTQVVDWNAGEYPFLKDIKKKYLHADSKLISIMSGTNSIVERYRREGCGSQISIRVSKIPSFRIFKTPGLSPAEKIEPYNPDISKKQKQLKGYIRGINTEVLRGNVLKCDAKKQIEENTKKINLKIETYKKQIIQDAEDSFYNWVESSKNGLSPELYFYGYMKDANNPEQGGLFLCIVNKGYDTDLYSFYKSGPGKTSPSPDVDEYIANQLLDLFNKMITPPLKLLCFDIKLENCVININNYEVKLIDWDEDWCMKIPEKLLEKGLLTEFYSMVGELYEQFNILNQIIMANHFYYSERNIFRNYFLRNKGMFDLIIDSLRVLFCSRHAMTYPQMAAHYFKIQKSNCEELFNELYKRCFLLNKDDTTDVMSSHNHMSKFIAVKENPSITGNEITLKQASPLPGFMKPHEEFDMWNTVDESVEAPSMGPRLELMKAIQSVDPSHMNCPVSDKSAYQMQGLLADVYPFSHPLPMKTVPGKVVTLNPQAKQATLQPDALNLLAHAASQPCAAASQPVVAASQPGAADGYWENQMSCDETIGGGKKKKRNRKKKKTNRKKKKSKKRR